MARLLNIPEEELQALTKTVATPLQKNYLSTLKSLLYNDEFQRLVIYYRRSFKRKLYVIDKKALPEIITPLGAYATSLDDAASILCAHFKLYDKWHDSIRGFLLYNRLSLPKVVAKSHFEIPETERPKETMHNLQLVYVGTFFKAYLHNEFIFSKLGVRVLPKIVMSIDPDLTAKEMSNAYREIKTIRESIRTKRRQERLYPKELLAMLSDLKGRNVSSLVVAKRLKEHFPDFAGHLPLDNLTVDQLYKAIKDGF